MWRQRPRDRPADIIGMRTDRVGRPFSRYDHPDCGRPLIEKASAAPRHAGAHIETWPVRQSSGVSKAYLEAMGEGSTQPQVSPGAEPAAMVFAKTAFRTTCSTLARARRDFLARGTVTLR